MNRPRGAKPGSPVRIGYLEDLAAGEQVTIRGVSGDEQEAVTTTGVVWGRDFAVVWVQTARACEPTPWPVEDVRPRLGNDGLTDAERAACAQRYRETAGRVPVPGLEHDQFLEMLEAKVPASNASRGGSANQTENAG